MSQMPEQPVPMTLVEFTVIALVLGADPDDYRITTAYSFVRYQPVPDQPSMIVNVVRNALASAGVSLRTPS